MIFICFLIRSDRLGWSIRLEGYKPFTSCVISTSNLDGANAGQFNNESQSFFNNLFLINSPIFQWPRLMSGYLYGCPQSKGSSSYKRKRIRDACEQIFAFFSGLIQGLQTYADQLRWPLNSSIFFSQAVVEKISAESYYKSCNLLHCNKMGLNVKYNTIIII